MRPSDRIDSADGSIDITLDAPVPDSVFAINVAGSGFVAFIGRNGLPGRVYVAAGIAFPLRVSRVLSAGTTATTVVGLV